MNAVGGENLTVAVPEESVTIVTLLVHYSWANEGRTHTHSITTNPGAESVSGIIAAWLKSETAELIDWCVSEYAPIPF